jgi:hypothetical protein
MDTGWEDYSKGAKEEAMLGRAYTSIAIRQ